MEFVSDFVFVWFWLCQLRDFNIFVETHCIRLETAARKEKCRHNRETHAMRLYINSENSEIQKKVQQIVKWLKRFRHLTA